MGVSQQVCTTVPVIANTDYTFKAWAYTSGGTTSGRIRAVSGASPFGTQIATAQGSSPINTWHQISLAFNGGAATSVTVLINGYGAIAAVYIDDVELR